MKKPLWTAILMLGTVAPSHAWGVEGHWALAAAAQGRLEVAAQGSISTLLGSGVSLQDVANWADEVRLARQGQGRLVHDPEAMQLNHDFPDNGNWHFDNFPFGATSYEDTSAFATAHDVVHLINECIR